MRRDSIVVVAQSVLIETRSSFVTSFFHLYDVCCFEAKLVTCQPPKVVRGLEIQLNSTQYVSSGMFCDIEKSSLLFPRLTVYIQSEMIEEFH